MPESLKETADGLVTGVFAPIRLRMRNRGIAGQQITEKKGRIENESCKREYRKCVIRKGGDIGRHEQVTSLFSRIFSNWILQEIISLQRI